MIVDKSVYESTVFHLSMCKDSLQLLPDQCSFLLESSESSLWGETLSNIL